MVSLPSKTKREVALVDVVIGYLEAFLYVTGRGRGGIVSGVIMRGERGGKRKGIWKRNDEEKIF